MRWKSSCAKLIDKFKRTVKEPVYIPVIIGEVLKGKTVLVTGGTGGIGTAIAKRCRENGAKVIITGRNQEKLESISREINALPIILDIQDITQMKFAFETLVTTEKIDVLINNAGCHGGTVIGNTSEDDFNRIINTNLKGTYFLSQLFSNYLIANKINGNILNISSVSGHRPAISPYMLSKWGINGLTEGMAKRLIKYGIVVNGIAPGPVATEMLDLDGTDLNYIKSPAGRYVDPIEVANLAVYMISDMGKMIVGDTVYLTGGCGNLTYDDIEY